MSKLEGSSVLVTGAQGFLGSVIMNYLKQNGMRVKGTARKSSKNTFQDMIMVDLEEPKSQKLLEDAGPFDAVVHCAAVLPGNRHDQELLIANIKITENLLNWSNCTDVPYFVFASSCNIYGYQKKSCIETAMPDPPNRYAISKLACEHLLSITAKNHKMRICVLRISAPYGPDMKAETVIKRFIHQAAQKKPITIMGTGERSQEFVYQTDVARAFSKVLENSITGTYNISGAKPVSMLDLATTISEIFNLDPKTSITFTGIDPQEEYRGHYPIEAATNSFGYYPSVNLKEGLRRTAHAWGFI